MKSGLVRVSKIALAAGVMGVVAAAANSLAGLPTFKPGCPRIGVMCLDVWNPVICSNGFVYSNSCYAYVACATGCVPYGNGGPIEVE